MSTTASDVYDTPGDKSLRKFAASFWGKRLDTIVVKGRKGHRGLADLLALFKLIFPGPHSHQPTCVKLYNADAFSFPLQTRTPLPKDLPPDPEDQWEYGNKIFHGLSPNHSLKTLIVSNDPFFEATASPVWLSVAAHTPNLRTLHLPGNRWTHAHLKTVLDTLAALPHLVSLDLSGHRWSAEDVRAICEFLTDNRPALQELRLQPLPSLLPHERKEVEDALRAWCPAIKDTHNIWSETDLFDESC